MRPMVRRVIESGILLWWMFGYTDISSGARSTITERVANVGLVTAGPIRR